MEQITQLLKEINIAQVFVILSGVWFFYRRLDEKIEKLDVKIDNVEVRLNAKIEKLDVKIDNVEARLNAKIDKLDERLSEKIEDVDRRLCRIEGSLSIHGHCLFNQAKPEQKAE